MRAILTTSSYALAALLCLLTACYEQPEPVAIDDIISLRVLAADASCDDASASAKETATQHERLRVCLSVPEGINGETQVMLSANTGSLSGSVSDPPRQLTLSGAQRKGPIALDWTVSEASAGAQLTATVGGYQQIHTITVAPLRLSPTITPSPATIEADSQSAMTLEVTWETPLPVATEVTLSVADGHLVGATEEPLTQRILKAEVGATGVAFRWVAPRVPGDYIGELEVLGERVPLTLTATTAWPDYVETTVSTREVVADGQNQVSMNVSARRLGGGLVSRNLPIAVRVCCVELPSGKSIPCVRNALRGPDFAFLDDNGDATITWNTVTPRESWDEPLSHVLDIATLTEEPPAPYSALAYMSRLCASEVPNGITGDSQSVKVSSP